MSRRPQYDSTYVLKSMAEYQGLLKWFLNLLKFRLQFFLNFRLWKPSSVAFNNSPWYKITKDSLIKALYILIKNLDNLYFKNFLQLKIKYYKIFIKKIKALELNSMIFQLHDLPQLMITKTALTLFFKARGESSKGSTRLRLIRNNKSEYNKSFCW